MLLVGTTDDFFSTDFALQRSGRCSKLNMINLTKLPQQLRIENDKTYK